MNRRMRIVVMLLTLLSAAPATITFERAYGDGFNNYVHTVVQTRDDGYALTFQTCDSAHQTVLCLLKTDSLGNLEWRRLYHSPTNRGAGLGNYCGLCVTMDRGYVLAGDIGAPTVGDAWAVKTDSVGDTLWTYVHGGPGYDGFESVAPTLDSGCILTGDLSEGSDYGMALLKLDRNGQRQWLRFYHPSGVQTWGGSVWQTGDRGYLATGCIRDTGSNSIPDYYMVKTDSVGETLWTALYRPEVPGYHEGRFGASCPTADSGYALCGTALGLPDSLGGGNESYLTKFDSLGHKLWTRLFFLDSASGHQQRLVFCLQETPDHGFIVAGVQGPNNPSLVLMARFDSLSDTLWTRGYDGLDPTMGDWAYWVVNTRDHGFAVAGVADNYPAYLIKTDSMGLVYSSVNERAPARSMQSGLTAQPSPFRAGVAIRCALAGREPATLRIYDQAGRVVREFPTLDVKRGTYSVTWDGRDARGRLLAGGIYFVRLKAGDHSATEKLALQR